VSLTQASDVVTHHQPFMQNVNKEQTDTVSLSPSPGPLGWTGEHLAGIMGP
jgi:hypothetical protein